MINGKALLLNKMVLFCYLYIKESEFCRFSVLGAHTWVSHHVYVSASPENRIKFTIPWISTSLKSYHAGTKGMITASQ